MNVKKKSTAAYLFEWAKPHKGTFITSVVLAIFGVACGIVPYYCVGKIMTKLINGSNIFTHYLGWLGVAMAFWLLNIIFRTTSPILSHKATFAVISEVRKKICLKLTKLPLGKVLSRSSGETKNLIVEKVDSIEPTLAHMLPEMTSDLLIPLALVGYLLIIDWRMALVSLITLPIGIPCFMAMGIGYEKRYKHFVDSNIHLNTVAVEYINGIEVIKAFNQSASSYERFTDAARVAAYSCIDWMKHCQTSFSLALSIIPAIMIGVLPFGIHFYLQGTLTLNDFLMIIILSLGVMPPIISGFSFVDDMQKIGTIVGNIASVLEEEEMIRPTDNDSTFNDMTIEAKNVSFAYAEKDVLHDVNFKIKPNSVVAFVGPSGSGKSTIARLIASMWDVNHGSIKIGNKNIKDISLKQINSMIAYVAQDNFLSDDTIRNNIRLGNLSATDSEVEKVARMSGCYDFIMNLESGFETRVGSSGGHLSGGERQRIAIARAMLKNAPIVILDEATAYTDPENEAEIQEAVSKLVKGKTLIVIAHRLSTIIDSDKIFVVEKGRIIAQGNHLQLLKKCNLYNKMFTAHNSVKDA